MKKYQPFFAHILPLFFLSFFILFRGLTDEEITNPSSLISSLSSFSPFFILFRGFTDEEIVDRV